MIRLVILTNVRIPASRPYVCRRQDLRLSYCRGTHDWPSIRVCRRQDLRLLLGRVAYDSI